MLFEELCAAADQVGIGVELHAGRMHKSARGVEWREVVELRLTADGKTLASAGMVNVNGRERAAGAIRERLPNLGGSDVAG